LAKDRKVFLYSGIPTSNKKGKIHYSEQLAEEPFRLIVAQAKKEPSKEFWFVSNDFELSAQKIAEAYRRGWDIEVFFHFIK